MKTICILLLAACVAAEPLYRPDNSDCDHRRTRLEKFSKALENESRRKAQAFNAEPLTAEVLGMCADRKDGDYQHPSECSKFVKCSNSMEYVMSCPSELVFNTKIDACDYKANVYCLVPVAENAEFHAKDKKPAVVDLSHLPATAKITQVKLEYVSGSVTCAKGRSGSKWGCNNLPPNTYTKEVIGVLLTDNTNKIFFSESTMPGYTGNSPFIVFNQFRNRATETAVKVGDLPNGEMRIWYNEDLAGSSYYDNSGSVVCKVYVTVTE